MGDFVCGLLNNMRNRRANRIEVQLRPEDEGMELYPWIESDNFNPGYLMRGLDKMPRRGDKHEWRHNQDYWAERVEIPAIDFNASEFVYDGVRSIDRSEPELQEA
jgi:coproporphyrinogen III oxidase-like Fe-S oxidoreductase